MEPGGLIVPPRCLDPVAPCAITGLCSLRIPYVASGSWGPVFLSGTTKVVPTSLDFTIRSI